MCAPREESDQSAVLHILIKVFDETLWVAKDTTVKRTAKAGHCRDAPIDLSLLCSVLQHFGSIGFG